MAFSSNPLRNEAEEFIQAEIARLGPDGLDKASIVRRFVDRGASRTRVHAWIAALVADAKNPPPNPLEVEVARVEAMTRAAERAKNLNALPPKTEIRDLQQEATAAIRVHRRQMQPPGPSSTQSVAVVAGPISVTDPTVDEADVPGVLPAAPGASAVIAKLERVMETVESCITNSFGNNGQVRNPRMALAAAETLRKCLETAVRLHEAVDNLQAVQTFMAEIMAELRGVSPEMANRVIERLRSVTSRWAK